MSAPLDSRVTRIVRWLISQSEPRSTSDLAVDLVLTERAVRYRLSAAENYLESFGASLVRQRGTGLFVEVSDEERQAILDDLGERSTTPRVYAPDEREHLLLDSLLWNHPATTALDRLNEDLEVSKTSARRDLRRCEPWLERMGLPLVRKSGKGIALIGSEQRVRRALVQLFLEAIPADVLDELLHTPFKEASLIRVRVPVGLQDRFASLSVYECAQAVSSRPLREQLAAGNSELVYTLYLAVTEARVSQGHAIDLDPGQYRSLIEHPAFQAVRKLADSLADMGRPKLSDEEVAGLTEYLLGFDALNQDPMISSSVETLVDEILAMATDRLHQSLLGDDLLRRGLSSHFSRLLVRLNYGLPVHNPLADEVAVRYPEVQAVADEVRPTIEDQVGAAISDDELGFVTMYLSGAMERANLRPRRRAMVVCPSGMATAWVLVSRLQAEFPELALVQVLSASEYEQQDTSDFNIVISTISLPEIDTPVVVVSPLLSSSDVQALAAVL